MPITVTIEGERELLAKFANLSGSARAKLVDAVVDSQQIVSNRIAILLSGEVLNRRTGHLRDSRVSSPVRDTGSEISGTVGVNEPYARIHEFGGTISPKNVGALTIPLDAVLTGEGVARYTAHEVRDNPSIGGFTSTFVKKGLIFGRVGGDIVPLFALKMQVTMPARPYMSRALDESEDAVRARLSRAIDEAQNT